MSDHLLPICTVCGAQRNIVTEDTWFFVGGPTGCKHVCSRACLIVYARRLVSTLCPKCGRPASSLHRCN